MNKMKWLRFFLGIITFAFAIIFEKLKVTNEWLSLIFFIMAYITFGGDVVWRALKNIIRGRVFDENFLMSLATIGAFAVGEPTEAVGVMLFYQIGEYFQERAVTNSKKSIASLMDIRPDYANLIKYSSIDAQTAVFSTEKVAPDTVSAGDFILVKPGEKIPLDGVITEGRSMLDVSALTGESVPRKAETGDSVLSGCINQTGVLTIKVEKTFGESTVSKIINLVENASSRKAKTENFITTFARYYTPVVVLLAALLAVLPPLLFGGLFADWLRRALVFLVISCPCALVLSIPMGFFAAIGKAAKSGILVKGGNYLEAFNNLEIAVFDKTGTLTKGVFKVTKILPAQGYSECELLELASYAEAYSNHPIALSILKEYGKEVNKTELSEYTEIAGQGVSVKKDGITILAGNDKLMEQGAGSREQGAGSNENFIGTKVYVAFNSSNSMSFGASSFIYVGCIVISDEIKADSKAAITALKAKGVQKTVMLTGDNPQIANAVAFELGIDEVYAGLLPHEKVEKLESLNKQKSPKGRIAFIGDGINDAPVLAMADIGIAMGGLGSDAAIEAADAVLMTDEPSKLTEVINIARFTKKIVWQNIVFALGIKSAFLVLGAFGIAGMWEAVFADVGVALLAVMNSMRILGRIRQT